MTTPPTTNTQLQGVKTMTTTTYQYYNRHLYTDVIPFEVVRVVSSGTIDIRQMKATQIASATLLGVGGFAGCWDNSTQGYSYESDENMPIIRIRLHANGEWRCKDGNRYKGSTVPIKHYDRNF
jgi:hypothetical protein